MNKEEIKEIVKDTIKELRVVENIGTAKDIMDFWCGEEKKNVEMIDCDECNEWVGIACALGKCQKKEFPQVEDEYWFITDQGHICSIEWDDDDYDNDRRGFGNVFQTEEEAEAVRDLRKHEAKCWELIDKNLDGWNWAINGFAVGIKGNGTYTQALQGYTFPTEELAQERSQILKRLAKIRGLI